MDSRSSRLRKLPLDTCTEFSLCSPRPTNLCTLASHLEFQLCILHTPPSAPRYSQRPAVAIVLHILTQIRDITTEPSKLVILVILAIFASQANLVFSMTPS
jgi:hypothetical protein